MHAAMDRQFGLPLPDAVRNQVAELLYTDMPITQIAQEVGVGRDFVYSVNDQRQIRDLDRSRTHQLLAALRAGADATYVPKPKKKAAPRYEIADQVVEIDMAALEVPRTAEELRIMLDIPHFARHIQRGTILRFEWIDFKKKADSK